MKYMMMMHTPSGPYQIGGWAPEDFKAHIQYMKAFAAQLQKDGEWVDGQGLTGPDQAKRVRASDTGAPITDGVFPETKEFLAGYWLIDVESPERAYALAAHASMAPGPKGKPLHLSIEVRQVMSAP